MKKHLFLFAMLLLLSMAAKAQVIIVSPTSLTNFSFIENEGPSGDSAFMVSATDLIDIHNIADTLTVTANSCFEISIQSDGDYGNVIHIIADPTGTIEETSVYVRMKEGLPAGSYFEVITVSSELGLASDVNVYCGGTVIMPTLPAPAFSLESGTYPGEQQVSITNDVEGAIIQYRLNPTEAWTDYAEPILVDRDMTICAKAIKDGYYDSQETCAAYSIEYVIEGNCDTVCGEVTGGGTFNYNEIATLTAVPKDGYKFSSWNNNDTINPMVIHVTGNASYTANFEAIGFHVTVIADPEDGGTVILSGEGDYQFPDTPTVTAVANEYYTFVNWTENDFVVSDLSDYTITGWASHELVAHFKLTTAPIIVGEVAVPSPICAGNALELISPEVKIADSEGWQMSPDSTFAIVSPYTDQILDETYDGWRLRYVASNEVGTTCSEQVAIAVYPVVEEDDVVSIVGKKCGDKIEHILVYPRKGYCYQWYLDGEALADTAQYIHSVNGLKSGTYRVEISLSRDPDGELRCPVSSPEYEVRWLGKSVYPNPSHPQSTLFVENDGEEDAVLSVVSVEGKTVYRQLLKTGQNTLGTILPKGIYVFSIADSQSIRTEKVIIQ